MRLYEMMPELGGVKRWLNGNYLTTKDVFEKPVFIHFWSVSCPECKKPLPEINHIYHAYKDVLYVFGVHMPRSESDKDIKEINDMVQKYGIKYPVAIDNEYFLTKAFQNKSVPSYYIFDGKSFLRYHQKGAPSMALIKRRIYRMMQ